MQTRLSRTHVLYDPFGAVVALTLPPGLIDRLFTGQRYDAEPGFYDYARPTEGTRFYDPHLGQFTQPDSIVPDPMNPLAWNRFGYVYNDPVNLTDLSGHFPWVAAGIAAGVLVGGTIGGARAYQQGYDWSTSEFWRATATGAVFGGLAGGLLGTGAGILGLTAVRAWGTAYLQSSLFSWWAGGARSIVGSWRTLSTIGKLRGVGGLLLRVPATSFAVSQMSVNYLNAIPGALGAATQLAFTRNSFLMDAVINTFVYAAYAIPTGSWNSQDAAAAAFFGGVGGMANGLAEPSWRTLTKFTWYFTVSSATVGTTSIATSYLKGEPIDDLRPLTASMLSGGLAGQGNFAANFPLIYYLTGVTAGGSASGLTNLVAQ